MVYLEKFIAVVKVGGKVMREIDDTVMIPLGSEYSIMLKNMNCRTAVVNISIDGKDVLEGQRVIVRPNESVDVEGYLDRSGNVPHKFKFIEKTAQISEHRGDRVDDGMIRIEYRYEAAAPEPIVWTTTDHHHHHHHHDHYHPAPWKPIWTCGTNIRGTDSDQTFGLNTSSLPTTAPGASGSSLSSKITKLYSSEPMQAQQMGGESKTSGKQFQRKGKVSCNYSADNIPVLSEEEGRKLSPHMYGNVVKDGITVKGAASDQKFKYGSVGTLETNSQVIVLRLRGTTSDGKPIEVARDVKQKLPCETCGTHNKSNAKFCRECGTSLV